MTNDKKTKVGTVIGIIGLSFYFLNRKSINLKIKKAFKKYEWFNASLNWYRKPKNKSIVNGLHPYWRDKVKEFLSFVEKNTEYDIILTSGTRSFEKQKQLNSKNSSNANAGLSYHNYGLALDLNLVNRKTGFQLMKRHSKSLWLKSGVPQIAKNKFGFLWGGDFKNYHDPIHFRPKNIPNTRTLLSLYRKRRIKNGFVKLVK